MSPKHFLPAVAAALLCLTACDIDDIDGMSRVSRDFHFSYPLAAAGRLSLETFNGSVEISGWDQNTIDISGSKYGRSDQDVDALAVNIDHTPDSVSIRVVRPSDRYGNRGARFVIKVPRTAVLDRVTSSNGAIRTVDGAGPARFHTSNAQIQVHGLRGSLDAQTSNGSMELVDIAGDVSAHTSNARVRAERIQGGVDLTSSNGGINADVQRADKPVRIQTSNSSVDVSVPNGFSNEMRVDTHNGAITLRVPSALNAHVVARTSNGHISSDFDLRMQGELGRNHLDAVLGAGGPLIDLTTSNGPIRLARM